MCDLLQHSETRTCPAGYFGGSARVGSLAQYMEKRIRALIQSRTPTLNGEASHGEKAVITQEKNCSDLCLNGAVPSIVVSEPPEEE